MNTPAHLLVGAGVFARPGQSRITVCALLGAVLPDLSLYVMAGIALFVLGISPDRVFNTLYFSDAWQRVFAIDNSFLLWGAAFSVALWTRSGALLALTGAALLHLCLDFPLHHDDARPHFWPLSDWTFESPISYWDSRHHAGVVAPLEAGLAVLMAGVVWQRYRAWKMRLFVVILLAAEVWVIRQWLVFF